MEIENNMKENNLPEIEHIKKNENEVSDLLGEAKLSWIGGVYSKYFKNVSFVRALIIKIWPVYVKYAIARANGWNKKTWEPLIKLKDAIEKYKFLTINLYESERVITPAPEVFPSEDACFLKSPHDSYNFPSIYVSIVPLGVVSGGTNFIRINGETICHDLFDFVRDYTSEELHGRLRVNGVKKMACWLYAETDSETIPSGASFVDACAPNYAHWLTEVLPRIAAFCSDDRFNDIPLIVNQGLHENIMESIFSISGSSRKVITLPIGKSLRVHKLYVTSVAGYVPFDRRKNKSSGHSQGVFSPIAIRLVCENLPSFTMGDEINWPERIYLKRNSHVRLLENSLELEHHLVNEGFVIISPEELTFIQQVQLFRHAKFIISSTGAALANIIFSPVDAKIIILMSKYRNMSYWYWQNIACATGKKITYVLGAVVGKKRGIHSDFKVNIQHVLKAVKENLELEEVDGR
ncbi:glycosyltransferase family 61 protein [Dickeya zeae]|nr:glycosyltransferase family 61 protein [Dickeya zeae]